MDNLPYRKVTGHFFFQFYIFRSRRLKATFKKVSKVASVVPEVLVSHAVCKDVQSNNT